MAYYLLAPWLNAFGSALVIGIWLYAGAELVAQGNSTLAGVSGPLALWLGALLLPGVLWAVVHRLRLRDERFGSMLCAGLVYPGLLLLGLVGTWRAVGRHATGRNGWIKTERAVEAPFA